MKKLTVDDYLQHLLKYHRIKDDLIFNRNVITLVEVSEPYPWNTILKPEYRIDSRSLAVERRSRDRRGRNSGLWSYSPIKFRYLSRNSPEYKAVMALIVGGKFIGFDN